MHISACQSCMHRNTRLPTFSALLHVQNVSTQLFLSFLFFLSMCCNIDLARRWWDSGIGRLLLGMNVASVIWKHVRKLPATTLTGDLEMLVAQSDECA